MLKKIELYVPNDKLLPEIINHLTPEENYLMIRIGCDCLKEARESVAKLSQQELTQKIKEETKIEMEKLEIEIMMERELSKRVEERINCAYEVMINEKDRELDKFKNLYEKINQENTKKIVLLEMEREIERETLKLKEQNMNETIQNKINQEKEIFMSLLDEKQKQVDKIRETYEKILTTNNKSASLKGSEGEKKFEEYADTFKDFKEFKLIDKHTQGGEGDFHLNFEEFNILVDAKNYKKKVPVDQREKIKTDLTKNEHIQFGWLVSLNTSIDKFDRSPIMYEWINTKQCLVYINNLSSYEDPSKILRIVWFTCKELYKLIKDVNFDETELSELRENSYKMMDKIRGIRKTIKEINTSLNTTRNLIQVMDDDLRGMLETETNEIVSSNFSLFDDWWNQKIRMTNEEILVSSTDLWNRFKQENKIMIQEINITGDKFKQYIKSKVPLSSIILRNKNSNSAFDIKGLKVKEQENIVVEEKMELVFNEEALKKKKVIKHTNK
jgi:hypothetical protein